MSFDLTGIVMTLVIILISMILHEVMHGVTAYWLGDDTAQREGRLTLNPIAHIDPVMTVLVPVVLYVIGGPIFGAAKPVPFNPARVKFDEFGAALVAAAGPLTNLVLAFVFFGLGVFVAADPLSQQFFTLAVSINLGFFAFNILPLPPLDGSRVLYAFAPEFVRRGMEAIERYGITVIFVLVLLGGSLFGTVIAVIKTFFLSVFRSIYGV